MTTPEFGGLWGQHLAEARVACPTPLAFDAFMSRLQTALGVRLVEFIPATVEAIFVGKLVDDPSALVLLHAKSRGPGAGAVDMIVRSKAPHLTAKAVDRLRVGV